MGCLFVWSIAYAQTQLKEVKTNLNIPDYVIIKTNPPSEGLDSERTATVQSHSVRASKTPSEENLRFYLASKNSPLAEYVGQLIQSDYWSTIIGICTIEEYSCSVNPYESNNLWGLMAKGKIIRFNSLSDGLLAINAFLARAESNGRTTIESFRGWYCASECSTWESTVIKTKLYLESL